MAMTQDTDSAATASPLTRDLARDIAHLRHADLPEAALRWVRVGFTDTFATLVAGRHSEEARLLREALAPSAGPARVFVDQGTARPHEAAWLNATAAHALDYDDAAQRGHISVVVVPAILAEAEALGLDGRRMACAYVAGYETWAELMRREPDPHHNRSWHPTGVLGPLAAAAACASLHGLDAGQTCHALAIAASQAAGLIANFGTMTKPYHAGRAAQAGVMAARLAAQGFTGTPDALEHPKGLLMGISPERRVDLSSPVQAGTHGRLAHDGINIKKYPNCFATHRALDGMLDLVRTQQLTADQVQSVRVTISRRNRSTLRYARPRTVLEAKFSMEFAMAAAVVAGRCGLAELDAAFLARDDVQSLMQRVSVLPEDAQHPRRLGEAPQDIVEVRTTDGRELRIAVDDVRGGPEQPLSDAELFAKFESCLRTGGLRAAPRPLFEALMGIDRSPGTASLYSLASD